MQAAATQRASARQKALQRQSQPPAQEGSDSSAAGAGDSAAADTGAVQSSRMSPFYGPNAARSAVVSTESRPLGTHTAGRAARKESLKYTVSLSRVPQVGPPQLTSVTRTPNAVITRHVRPDVDAVGSGDAGMPVEDINASDLQETRKTLRRGASGANAGAATASSPSNASVASGASGLSGLSKSATVPAKRFGSSVIRNANVGGGGAVAAQEAAAVAARTLAEDRRVAGDLASERTVTAKERGALAAEKLRLEREAAFLLQQLAQLEAENRAQQEEHEEAVAAAAEADATEEEEPLQHPARSERPASGSSMGGSAPSEVRFASHLDEELQEPMGYEFHSGAGSEAEAARMRQRFEADFLTAMEAGTLPTM